MAVTGKGGNTGTVSGPGTFANKPQYTVDQARPGLQEQVKNKQISQAAMDAQLNNITNEWNAYNQGQNQSVMPSLGQGQSINLAQAQRDLQDQVNKGWITPEQMQAQMNINMQQANPMFANTPLGNAGQIANIQGQFNNQNMLQQAQFNRVNEINPYGSSEYVRNPDGSYTRKSDLSANQQTLLNNQQSQDIQRSNMMGGLLGQAQKNLGQQFSYSGMPQALGAQDLQGDRKRIEDQVFNQYQQDIQRQGDEERRRLEQQLANSGIPRGSEMYRQQMDDFNRRQAEQLNRARTMAMTTSRDEMQTMFDLSGRSRDRAVSEAKDLRYMPLNEIQSLLGQQTGIQNPQFAQMSGISAPNVDFGGYASNMYGYGQQTDLQNLQFQQQKDLLAYQQELQNKKQTGRGGGGGGGGGWSLLG